MKMLVATSSQYSFLLEAFVTLYQKYWPGQEVVFLGFDECEFAPLPDGFDFVSLGKQADFGRRWTDPLIPYIKSLEDEYFGFTVEDVVLIDHVDQEKVDLLEKCVKEGAHKAHLDNSLQNRCTPYKEGLLAAKQNASYRTSLAPSIWRKEYFLKFLKPGYTAWDFELKNMGESYDDGALILSLDQPDDLYYNCNVFFKGQPIPRPWCGRLYGTSTDIIPHPEDIDYLLAYLQDHKDKQRL